MNFLCIHSASGAGTDEAELAAVVKDDPLAAYDVDVRQEGLAIQEYLMLLQQRQKQ